MLWANATEGVQVGDALWRRAFDAVEGVAAPLTERVVREPAFGTVVVVVRRARSLVERESEKRSKQVLHLLNLPAGPTCAGCAARSGRSTVRCGCCARRSSPPDGPADAGGRPRRPTGR